MIRAARYLGVAPWDLARRPITWQEWAICFESAEAKAQEIAEKIGQQRRDISDGQGQRGGEENDEAWRVDLLAQIEAQGGIIAREGEG